MNKKETVEYNRMDDDDDLDDNNEIENFDLGGENSSNNNKTSGIDNTFLTEVTANETFDDNMHDGNHDNGVDNIDNVNMHDDNYEENYAGSVDTSTTLNVLHDIFDATRKREIEDSDFYLGKLFNMNVSAGGCVEKTKVEDSLGQLVYIIGFSY